MKITCRKCKGHGCSRCDNTGLVERPVVPLVNGPNRRGPPTVVLERARGAMPAFFRMAAALKNQPSGSYWRGPKT